MLTGGGSTKFLRDARAQCPPDDVGAKITSSYVHYEIANESPTEGMPACVSGENSFVWSFKPFLPP